MTFSEEIKRYTDEWGLVHPTTVHDSQNGVTYLGYSLALKALTGEMRYEDTVAHVLAIKAVSRRPGLVCRVPEARGWGYQNQIDDFIGAICGAKITGTTWSTGASIYAYGFENDLKVGPLRLKYFYNTDCPGTQLNSSGKKNWPAWLGRFPIFRVLVSWGVGFHRTWPERFIFAFDCLWSACFSKQIYDTPIMMLFLKLQAFGSPRLRKICTRILNLRKITYKKAFELYFGQSHPLTRYFPEKNPWGDV